MNNATKSAFAILNNLHYSYPSLSANNSVKYQVLTTIFKRFYSPEPSKRFYADVLVKPSSSSSGNANANPGGVKSSKVDHKLFEIHLDKNQLKTPRGKQLLCIKSETLAHAIATEWASQKRHVLQAQMHLTALANTVQDNPLYGTKSDVIANILNCLPQDTIIFRCPDNPKLLNLQTKEWDPIVHWFEKEFNVTIPIVESSILPSTSFTNQTLTRIRSSLEEFNFETLHGLHYGVGAVQSVILTLAVAKQRLSIEEAVQLARLEVRFQIDHWGNVEWSHDIEMFDSMARLSAAMIFLYTHSKPPF